MDHSILRTLHLSPGIKNLKEVALAFGEDNTVTIAEIAVSLRNFGIGAMGASTSICARPMEKFGTAVKRYQDALLEYRNAVKSNSTAGAAAKQKAVSAFQNMQRGFQKEISAITSSIRARRGIALTNSTRAINIARSSRRVAKLSVFNAGGT